MLCPKCKCEVGSQKACPYCGTPLPAPEPTKGIHNDIVNAINRNSKVIKNLDVRLRNLEDKLNVMLVMHAGTMVILILILIALRFK